LEIEAAESAKLFLLELLKV
jgi:hypothetical protein